MHSETFEDHPNLTLLKQINLQNIASSKDAFAEDVVLHYFNPRLPEMQGDYVGVLGLRSFFTKIGEKTKGNFKVIPVSAEAVGGELVVTQTQNNLTFDGAPIETDVVVVWRVVDGRISEIWDIPSAFGGVRAAQ